MFSNNSLGLQQNKFSTILARTALFPAIGFAAHVIITVNYHRKALQNIVENSYLLDQKFYDDMTQISRECSNFSTALKDIKAELLKTNQSQWPQQVDLASIKQRLQEMHSVFNIFLQRNKRTDKECVPDLKKNIKTVEVEFFKHKMVKNGYHVAIYGCVGGLLGFNLSGGDYFDSAISKLVLTLGGALLGCELSKTTVSHSYEKKIFSVLLRNLKYHLDNTYCKGLFQELMDRDAKIIVRIDYCLAWVEKLTDHNMQSGKYIGQVSSLEMIRYVDFLLSDVDNYEHKSRLIAIELRKTTGLKRSALYFE